MSVLKTLRNSLRGRSNSSNIGKGGVVIDADGGSREESNDNGQPGLSAVSSPGSFGEQTSVTSSSESSRLKRVFRFARRASSAASKKPKGPSLAELTQQRSQGHVVHWASEQSEVKRMPTPPSYDEAGEANRAVIIRRSSSSLDGKRNSNEFSLADLTGNGAVGLMRDHNYAHQDDLLICTTTSAPISPALTPVTHWPPGDLIEEHSDAKSMTPSAMEEASQPPTNYGMHSVCYVVKDIDRSLQFYEHFLGMEHVNTIDNGDHKMHFIGYSRLPTLPQISRRSSHHDVGSSSVTHQGSDAVSLRSAHAPNFGCRTGLIQLISIPGTEDDPTFDVKHTFGQGYQHLSISVPNVAKAMRRFKTLGAVIVDDVADNGRFGVIEDPDGYNIMIMAQSEGQDAWLSKQVRETMLLGRSKGKERAIASELHDAFPQPIAPAASDPRYITDDDSTLTAMLAASSAQPDAPAASPLLNVTHVFTSSSVSSASPSQQFLTSMPTGTTVTTTSTLAESTEDAQHLRLIERAQTAKGGTPASLFG